MFVLRIEHHVPDFAKWKKAFDDDPAGRQKSGVLSYSVMRPVDEPNHAMVDLVFEDMGDADVMLGAIRVLWGRVQGNLMTGPQAKIVEILESKTY